MVEGVGMAVRAIIVKVMIGAGAVQTRQMIGTLFCVSFLQYFSKRPCKVGEKVWVLAEAETGYVLPFQVYTGAGEDWLVKVLHIMSPWTYGTLSR